MPEPTTPDRLAEIAALLGDVAPASDRLVTELAQTVRDRREHEHDQHEDFYCGNLAGWAGERVGSLLARLTVACTEVDRLTNRVAELEAATEQHDVNEMVQCNDCGAVGQVVVADDGLAYLAPSGQIGHHGC